MYRLLLIILLSPFLGLSQTLTPEVVATSGDHFNASPGQLSWTLGELSVETYNGSSNQLTQGFHQPENGLVSLDELSNIIQINAYPNPFKTILNIESDSENFRFSVFNALGEEVKVNSIGSTGTKQLDFSDLSSGIYLLKFTDNTGKLNTIKVQKF